MQRGLCERVCCEIFICFPWFGRGKCFNVLTSTSDHLLLLLSGDRPVWTRSAKGRRGERTPPLPEMAVPTADPEGRYTVLAILTTAVVFGLATWFSATAVR